MKTKKLILGLALATLAPLSAIAIVSCESDPYAKLETKLTEMNKKIDDATKKDPVKGFALGVVKLGVTAQLEAVKQLRKLTPEQRKQAEDASKAATGKTLAQGVEEFLKITEKSLAETLAK
ncbi:hypothetical protein [Mycoplasmopsis alligatoris]|uniref:Lipoprotein n=1 Tax=Mycoplasmopsis alligatoris A21JP2 TaxID=747682 RepID=D4XWQ2_9BACT|nr:hypothetical protein [Mycoplasmopsis alligatoris]EFF41250.1 hypothetical protein MALL_0376 [Mycoplasmopsis alligatoris A21JP2]